MRPFLKRLSLFGIGVLFLNALLWPVSEKILFAGYSKGFEVVTQRPFRTLFLGDSHVEALGNAPESSQAFNFGYASDSPPDMLAKLFYVLNRKVPVKLLVLPADDHFLNNYRIMVNNRERVVQFSTRSAYKKCYKQGSLAFMWEKYVLRHLPVFAVQRAQVVRRSLEKQLSEMLFKKMDKESETDWVQLSDSQRRSSAEARIDAHFSSSQSTNLVALLISSIAIARSNDLAVVAIRYPLTEEYRTLAAKRFQGETVASLFKREGVQVYDFSAFLDGHPDCFKDADHLNARGADLLWKSIETIINGSDRVLKSALSSSAARPIHVQTGLAARPSENEDPSRR